MSKDALKKLTIEHLRGSVVPFSLPFEKGKNLTLVYGENGTGKSTICDAFEFLGKGNVGSLDKRGLGRTRRYWVSHGKNAADVSVTLESGASACCAKMSGAGVVVAPTEDRPSVEVLRRSQILSLIEAQPADRYNTISKFIDVSGAEKTEDALRNLIKTIESSREVAVARVQENSDSIQRFWEEAGSPPPDHILWAVNESKRDPNEFDADIKAIGELSEAYSKLKNLPEQLRAAKQVETEALEAQVVAQGVLKESLLTVADDAAETVGLLESAKTYFEKNGNPEACPLCESTENAEGLSVKIEEKLTALASLQKAQRNLAKCDKAVTSAATQLENLKRSSLGYLSDFKDCIEGYSWPDDVTLPPTDLPENPAEWKVWLDDNAKLPDDWKKAETTRLGSKQFLNALKGALETYSQNVDEQKDIDVLLPRLKRALEIAEEERRQFTDTLLSQISKEVGRLYEIVHTGEGLNKISLELNPEKRASLDIGASFCGEAAPPQAYFSDSHLDTLGLCVFLALAALENPSETILVLDDVLASVDEPHVDRLIEMLYQEVKNFRHCVITTHYRPWKQKLRWGWLQNGQCQFVELTKWTATNGLLLIRSVPDLERLNQLLSESPPDPQLVCAKAGIILEAALEFLTLHYECSVPRRPNGFYTIGDLLPAVDKKLRQALKVEVKKGVDEKNEPIFETVELAAYFAELTRIAQARNVFGCHFNQMSFELLEADALGFGQVVLELMNVLTDGNAGWPRNGKSGSYWATTGETRRLHPYKRPV